MHKQCKGKVVLSLLLSIIMIFSVLAVGTVSMSAETSTGIGLCAYALNAYNEGWPYVWGGASYGAVDCSGLICSYNGVGGVRTDMVSSSQSAGLDWGYVSNGIPNIHGLGLHMPGHVGIYVGSGNAIDARGTNWGIIYGDLSAVNWVEWYKIVGVSYPESGWVKFDGESFYYENGEYIDSTSRTIDGVTYSFDSLGRSDKEPPESSYEVTDYSSSSSSKGNGSSNGSSSFLKVGSQGDRVKEVQKLLKKLGYFDDEVTGYYGTYTAACVKEFQKDANIEVDGIVGPEFMGAIKSDNAPSKNGADTSNNDKKEPTEAPTEATEAPTEKLTEAPTEATEATEAPTEKATEAPTEKATEAPTEAPTLPPTPLEDGVITYGENDVENCTEIADMQTRLTALGYYTGEITGVLDDATLAALHDYFAASDMSAEDFISQEQYDVLMSDAAVAKQVEGQYTQEQIDKVQGLLVKLGYLSKASGVYDEDTITAIKTAQANCDMEVTGEISDDLVKALEQAAARLDSQSTTVSGNATSTASTSTATVTTVQTADKTSGSPVTGYTFGEVSAPADDNQTVFIWVSGMALALVLGTTVVYIKNKSAKKKEN
ncbi:peptidoglycan-binding protein [Oscillospiraceae bacterium LCP25S3_E3]|nr:peptidoglycan-binding protein [Ruminococcus sp.]